MKNTNNPTAAILTFTDARDEGISNPEVENLLRRKQQEVRSYLEGEKITVIDPLSEIRSETGDWYGIRSLTDIKKIVRCLTQYDIDAVIVGAWTWSPPTPTSARAGT